MRNPYEVLGIPDGASSEQINAAYKEKLRIFIYSNGKKILPKPVAKLVKNFLRKRGKTFFSESI